MVKTKMTMENNNKKSLNWPLIIITGFGVIAIFLITFIFVQNLAISTVKDAILLEKAYPKIKPQEYFNELKIQAKRNKLEIKEIAKSDNIIVVQIIKKQLLDKLITEAPNASISSIVNLSIYNIGDGTSIVANNPYIWDMILPSSYLDDIVQSYSEEISMVLDSVYWQLKKKKQELK